MKRQRPTREGLEQGQIRPWRRGRVSGRFDEDYGDDMKIKARFVEAYR